MRQRTAFECVSCIDGHMATSHHHHFVFCTPNLPPSTLGYEPQNTNANAQMEAKHPPQVLLRMICRSDDSGTANVADAATAETAILLHDQSC